MIFIYHSALAYYSPHQNNSTRNNAIRLQRTQAGFIYHIRFDKTQNKILQSDSHMDSFCCTMQLGSLIYVSGDRPDSLLLHPVLPPGGVKAVAEAF